MKFLKLIFSVKYNSTALNVSLLILRLFVGIFMLTHGFPKFQTLISGEEIHFADPIGLGVIASYILVVFAEFFCSILLILGIFTRLSTIPLMFSMFVASFISHSGDPFSSKELSLLYMIIFAYIFIMGGGKYSIDNIILGRLSAKK